MNFFIKEKSSADIKVYIEGEVSIEERDKLINYFSEILLEMEVKKIKSLIIDFSGLIYIDSMGISYFIKLNKMINKIEKELIFINVPEIIKNIFSLLSLESYFNLK